MNKNKTVKKLEDIGLGTIRISRNDVPHIVLNGKSVAWFWSTNVYRVFWPYPSFGQEQNRRDFKDAQRCKEFLLDESSKIASSI